MRKSVAWSVEFSGPKVQHDPLPRDADSSYPQRALGEGYPALHGAQCGAGLFGRETEHRSDFDERRDVSDGQFRACDDRRSTDVKERLPRRTSGYSSGESLQSDRSLRDFITVRRRQLKDAEQCRVNTGTEPLIDEIGHLDIKDGMRGGYNIWQSEPRRAGGLPTEFIQPVNSTPWSEPNIRYHDFRFQQPDFREFDTGIGRPAVGRPPQSAVFEPPPVRPVITADRSECQSHRRNAAGAYARPASIPSSDHRRLDG